jgi:hypothetical protein
VSDFALGFGGEGFWAAGYLEAVAKTRAFGRFRTMWNRRSRFEAVRSGLSRRLLHAAFARMQAARQA